MEIREESPGDEAAIAALVAAAFAGAPHSAGTEAAIVAALRAAGALSLSLVAVEGGAAVGHVAFSPVAIGGRACGWLGLGPLAVLPGRQGGGIGGALVRAGLARLRAAGAAGCVLLGEPGYYRRFGFRAEPGLSLAGVPPAYFLALPFGAAVPRGPVTYHAAFQAAAPA